MRVLAIGSLYPPHSLGGGYELVWRTSMADLRSRGHSVRVLTTDFHVDDPVGEEEPDVHRELRWYWRDHAFPKPSWSERVKLERWNGAVLATHLESFEPDVVCWWAMGGMSLSLIERVRRARVPAVGVVCDSWMNYAPMFDFWTKPFRGRPGRYLAPVVERLTDLPTEVDLATSAHWLFISEHTRRRSVESTGPLLDSSVAHAGIDVELFQPAPAREWGWRLLYLGRIEDRKGVHVAVEALAHLPSDAVLTLQGHGEEEYLSSLRELAGRLGVLERLEFAYDGRAELPRFYADADVVLFPVQWDEPWGLVPLEAMRVGRPVIATGTGGSSEYLRHEENCLLYSPHDDASALAAAVTRLASDSGLRDRLRAGGFETAPRYSDQAYNDRIAAALDAAILGR